MRRSLHKIYYKINGEAGASAAVGLCGLPGAVGFQRSAEHLTLALRTAHFFALLRTFSLCASSAQLPRFSFAQLLRAPLRRRQTARPFVAVPARNKRGQGEARTLTIFRSSGTKNPLFD